MIEPWRQLSSKTMFASARAAQQAMIATCMAIVGVLAAGCGGPDFLTGAPRDVGTGDGETDTGEEPVFIDCPGCFDTPDTTTGVGESDVLETREAGAEGASALDSTGTLSEALSPDAADDEQATDAPATCGTLCPSGTACIAGQCICNSTSCPSGCCRANACAPMSVWYQDADNDGYGNPAISIASCVQPNGYVADNTDCCDKDPLANPNYLKAHASNPWQTVADACGDFLWNCESNGVPVRQYANLQLCTLSYCNAACPGMCNGYTLSNPACGQQFSPSVVTCNGSIGNCTPSMAINDYTLQGCY